MSFSTVHLLCICALCIVFYSVICPESRIPLRCWAGAEEVCRASKMEQFAKPVRYGKVSGGDCDGGGFVLSDVSVVVFVAGECCWPNQAHPHVVHPRKSPTDTFLSGLLHLIDPPPKNIQPPGFYPALKYLYLGVFQVFGGIKFFLMPRHLHCLIVAVHSQYHFRDQRSTNAVGGRETSQQHPDSQTILQCHYFPHQILGGLYGFFTSVCRVFKNPGGPLPGGDGPPRVGGTGQKPKCI